MKEEIKDAVARVFSELNIHCAYNMPSFWCNGGKDYKVIPTKYWQGYQKALEDAEEKIKEALEELNHG